MANNNTEAKEKKVTKANYFAQVRAIVSRSKAENKADLLEFIDHEVELLKKKSSSSKETNVQKANIAILATIKEVLAGMDKPVTIGELMEDSRLATYTVATKDGGSEVKKMTNQKLSSLIKILKDAKEVVRTEDKKKAYFSLPKQEEKAAPMEVNPMIGQPISEN